jgi:hypothetical protein
MTAVLPFFRGAAFDYDAIFRQPKFRDWKSVIDEVMAELAKR